MAATGSCCVCTATTTNTGGTWKRLAGEAAPPSVPARRPTLPSQISRSYSPRSSPRSETDFTYCVPDLAPHLCRDLSPALAPDPEVAPARLPRLPVYVLGLATLAPAAQTALPLDVAACRFSAESLPGFPAEQECGLTALPAPYSAAALRCHAAGNGTAGREEHAAA